MFVLLSCSCRKPETFGTVLLFKGFDSLSVYAGYSKSIFELFSFTQLHIIMYLMRIFDSFWGGNCRITLAEPLLCDISTVPCWRTVSHPHTLQDVAEPMVSSGNELGFLSAPPAEDFRIQRQGETQKLKPLPDTTRLLDANKNNNVWSSDSANIDRVWLLHTSHLPLCFCNRTFDCKCEEFSVAGC